MSTNNNYENSVYKILSRKQIQILKLIVCGLSDKEISEKLCRSIHTIKKHHQNIRDKTGAHSTGELILYAIKHGIHDVNTNLPENENNTAFAEAKNREITLF